MKVRNRCPVMRTSSLFAADSQRGETRSTSGSGQVPGGKLPVSKKVRLLSRHHATSSESNLVVCGRCWMRPHTSCSRWLHCAPFTCTHAVRLAALLARKVSPHPLVARIPLCQRLATLARRGARVLQPARQRCDIRIRLSLHPSQPRFVSRLRSSANARCMMATRLVHSVQTRVLLGELNRFASDSRLIGVEYIISEDVRASQCCHRFALTC